MRAKRPYKVEKIWINEQNVAHAWRKLGLFGEKNPNCDCFQSNQMP